MILIYCDDESHASKPIGLFTVADELVVPDGVFLVNEFRFYEGDGWLGGRVLLRNTSDGQRVWVDSNEWVSPEHEWAGTGASPSTVDPLDVKRVDNWAPSCKWCRQRGGRWKNADRDALLTKLEQQGVTGISLRGLDLQKHTST